MSSARVGAFTNLIFGIKAELLEYLKFWKDIVFEIHVEKAGEDVRICLDEIIDRSMLRRNLKMRKMADLYHLNKSGEE